jgi:hypothetical protein
MTMTDSTTGSCVLPVSCTPVNKTLHYDAVAATLRATVEAWHACCLAFFREHPEHAPLCVHEIVGEEAER